MAVRKTKPEDQLSREELERQSGEQLPDREQMSLVNANLALPINAAIAANVLSDGSVAYADAAQTTPINQGNLGLPTGA
jgi:2-polyprenyl-6-methoxyphenol hydroxylase-like FAD-dependent oxidoreductase